MTRRFGECSPDVYPGTPKMQVNDGTVTVTLQVTLRSVESTVKVNMYVLFGIDTENFGLNDFFPKYFSLVNENCWKISMLQRILISTFFENAVLIVSPSK